MYYFRLINCKAIHYTTIGIHIISLRKRINLRSSPYIQNFVLPAMCEHTHGRKPVLIDTSLARAPRAGRWPRTSTGDVSEHRVGDS